MNKFREWLTNPESELFRREVAWLRQWCQKFPGNLIIAAYVIFLFISIAGTQVFMDVFGGNPFLGAGGRWDWIGIVSYAIMSIGGIVLVVLSFGLWFFAIRSRTLTMLGPDRLPDIVLTPLDERDYWPGLLAAPVILKLALGAMTGFAGFLSSLMIGGKPYLEMKRALGGVEGLDFWLVGLRWIVPPLQVAQAIVIPAAITIFVVYTLVGRNATGLRVLFTIIGGYLAVYMPGIIFYLLGMIATLWFRFSSQSTPADSTFLLLMIIASAVLIPLLAILCALIMGRVCYRKLRDPEFILVIRKRAGCL